MTVLASLAALALIQTPAPTTAQTPPPATSSVTRDLNSGPPAPATYLTPPPSAAAPVTAAPAATQPRPTAATPVQPAAATPAPTPAASQLRPVASTPARTTPAPASAAAAPATTAPVRANPAPATTAPAAAATIAPATEAAPPPPPPPSYTVLDAPARAALPFRIDLPAGFLLDAERSGPDFKMYAVRRNGTPFVMIYAGPTSEFPIYGGEQVTAAGRTTIVVTEEGQRHAMEHLFDRQTAPHQIHIWVASLEGADRTTAEAIAQSVDAR